MNTRSVYWWLAAGIGLGLFFCVVGTIVLGIFMPAADTPRCGWGSP